MNESKSNFKKNQWLLEFQDKRGCDGEAGAETVTLGCHESGHVIVHLSKTPGDITQA